jgi:hypothetical protein
MHRKGCNDRAGRRSRGFARLGNVGWRNRVATPAAAGGGRRQERMAGAVTWYGAPIGR